MNLSAEALKNEGNRLLQAGQVEAAIEQYRRALAVDPAYVPALNNLGFVLKQTGRRGEAEACLRRAAELAPDDFELLNNLAVLLHEDGRLDAAMAFYRQALAIRPDDGFANGNYGALLLQQGQGEAAIEHCRAAAVACPDSPAILQTLAKVLRDTGSIDEALPIMQRAARLPDAGIEQASALLFALLYPPANNGGREWPAYVDFDRQLIRPRLAQAFRHPAVRPDKPRLRLGYVSAALRSHVTYFFIVGVLAQHDHARFEVVLYDTAVDKDEGTRRLAALADRYVDCAGLADRALAERIHADGVDILVDLDGHIGQHAQLALAWKPAPVQVTWLGYPHSTGSSAIDWWVSDRHIAGPGFADPHTERLAILPDFYMLFDAGPAPEPTELPALRNGYLTYGSFNAPNKLNDEVLAAWAQLLLASTDARLLIASSPGPRFEARVRAVLAAKGVTGERVRFAGARPHQEFLALHGEADVALDPFPVNGTTTSLFGLWMGVPLLTVAGDSHRARVGLSIMENLGLAAWVAATPAELAARAAELTADLAALATLRRGLRQRLAASPLCDAPRFARNFERLLLDAWRAGRAG